MKKIIKELETKEKRSYIDKNKKPNKPKNPDAFNKWAEPVQDILKKRIKEENTHGRP